MVAAVESMAYVGPVPWHGLGIQVQEDITPDQLRVAAGLDWTVSKRPMFVAGESEDQFTQLEDMFAITRDSDNKILSYSGKTFVPTQNSDILEFFSDFCKAGALKMETAGSLFDGKKIWALAKMNSAFSLAGDDLVEGYMLLSNSHVCGTALTAMFTPIRVVCNNTLTFALNSAAADSAFRMRHSKEFKGDMHEVAKEYLLASSGGMTAFQERALFLSKKKINRSQQVEFIARLSGVDLEKTGEVIQISDLNRRGMQILNAIENSPGAELEAANGTFWGTFNGLTYFTDHLAGRTQDNRINSAWFGDASRLKQRALDLAVKMAEAA